MSSPSRVGFVIGVSFIVAFACAFPGARAHAHAIDVALAASWRSSARVVDVLESHAEHANSGEYFALALALDAIAIDVDANERARACDEAMEEVASRTTRARTRATERARALTRSTRRLAPRIEAHASMANERIESTGCCRVHFGSRAYASVEEMKRGFEDGGERVGETTRTERDREYGVRDESLPTAVLYAAPGTGCFREFHDALANASDRGEVNYAFRAAMFDATCARANSCAAYGIDGKNLRLSGFGIELAVKNMEYKALDDSKVEGEREADEATASGNDDELVDEIVGGFNLATLAARYPDATDGLKAFRDDLQTKLDLSSDAPLKVWDIKDLGIQAAQRIALSDDPIKALVDLSQNFPSLADSLSRMKIDKTFAMEVRNNHRLMQPGGLVMSLNGEMLELDTIDIYTLSEIITKEIRYYEELANLELPRSTISKLLRLPKKEAQVKISIKSPLIQFYNDVEKDVKFARWSQDLAQLTFPSMGGFPRIRYNLYTIVAILDPSDKSMWDSIELMDQMVEGGIPVRAAQVIVTGLRENESERVKTEDALIGERIAKAANYLMRDHGAQVQSRFLGAVAANRKMLSEPSYFAPALYERPSWELARKVFMSVLDEVGGDEDPENVVAMIESAENTVASTYVAELRQEISKKGLKTQSFLLNGLYIQESAAEAYGTTIPNLLNHQFRQEMIRVKTMFVKGEFEGVKDIAGVINRGSAEKYIPWLLDEVMNPPVYKAPPSIDSSSSVRFAQSGDADEVKAMSLMVVANADTKTGARLISAASKYTASDAGMRSRFTVVHPGELSLEHARSRAVQAALMLPSRRAKIPSFLTEVFKGESVKDVLDISGLNTADFTRIMEDNEAFAKVMAEHRSILSHHGLKTKCAVIANGRVIDLTSRQCEMDAEDFATLATIEMEHRANTIYDEIMKSLKDGSLKLEIESLSGIIAHAAAVVAAKQASAPRKKSVQSLESIAKEAKRTAFKVGEGSAVEIEAILDPLSKEAQRVAPVLALLRDRLSEDLSIRVILNPRVDLTDLPLKSYYRYVVPPVSSSELPRAFITDIPTHKTLTMHVDFPEAWMVTTHKAAYDLDNLILKDVKERVVHAEYRLESILVTGHVSDEFGKPARGTQLVLEDERTRSSPGTIVMANLGYFQLPASPGMHKISLRTGRSADIFKFDTVKDIIDTEAFDRHISANSTSVDVFVDSFRGRLLQVTLKKRTGRESADVLVPKQGGAVGWISNMFSKGDTHIHIFSVASGHLYERFLKIMMASVKRTTKKPVKFWFIKNWLSPSFKDFLPYMAKEYDFEFELISYKWPTWLNKQTEKQRIIWAYKILFLDVLFPLELKKVIFVDADQIIRADMAELWNMNLHGAPYGYTPMCDNNKEMEGFRFWKQGFWKNHLRGKPYHISALYVVDLERFRELAAGDRLRGMYDQLSRDPGSLANLDQDLPNFAQHEVPIFSLPQPWLWCESWCGNETKSAAKTIDLCNNPLTKEPKLEGARRIVAEWPGLDEEVRAFTAKVERGEIQKQQPVVAKDEL